MLACVYTRALLVCLCLLATTCAWLPSMHANCGERSCHALACRFEELVYADSATYMQDGRVAYSGSPEDVKAFMRKLGAPV